MAGKYEASRAAEGGKKGGVVLLVVLAVLLAAYLALCAWVSGSGTILPKVTIAGLDVSGMTQEQALSALSGKLDQVSGSAVVTLRHGEWSGSIRGDEMLGDTQLGIHGANSVRDALLVGRSGNFLTCGVQFIANLMGGTDVPLDLSFQSAPQDDLIALIDQAHAAVEGDTSLNKPAYRMEGEELLVTKGITLTYVDGVQTEFDVIAAMEQQVFPALFAGEAAADMEVSLPLVEVEPEALSAQAVHDALYAVAAEPVYDKETNTVSDHTVGIDFDVAALQAAYEQAGEGETISVPLTITQPKDTKQEYEAKLFADVLGQGTSKVTGSANRKSNVKLSAAACDGVILMPGEIFSYNNTTGSRSPDKGYLPAPTYNNGASVDDVGGGICQTSSTIYYAMLHTTLEVVERQNHSYATGYVPDGMDATVFFGSLDFRFKNNTNYPLKVVTESYDSGGSRYLRVKLLGTNEDGRYAIPTNKVYDVVQPTNSYLADETVPQGSLVLDKQQNSYRGRKAQVTRTIYNADGTVAETQDLGVSRYKMRPNLYRYNPLDGDPATWPDGKPPQPAPVTPAVPEIPVEPPVEIAPPAVSEPGNVV